MNWANALAIAEKGFETWAAKDHNRKWVRKIDGTPIKNDLLVNIATAFAEAHVQPAPIAELEPVVALIDELRDLTALRYAGDCKCGKCQLVPRATLDKTIGALRQLEAHAAEAVRREREAWRPALVDAEQALTDAADYFSNRADVVDGDYGVPEPNKEMRLASQCDEANNRLSAAIRARGQV